MKNVIILLALIAIIGCKQTNTDFAHWYANRSKKGIGIDFIEFSKDSIRIMDIYGFKQSGIYNLETEKEISYSLTNTSIKGRFELTHLSLDSLIVGNSFVFYKATNSKAPSLYDDRRVEEFELIGLTTNHFLDEQRVLGSALHYYRTQDGKVGLRAEQRVIIDYQDILLALEGGHGVNRDSRPVIFLGKSVTPSELKKLYDYISLSSYRVWLVTKKEGLHKYHIIEDRIEIWWDERNKVYKEIRPPLPHPPLRAEESRNRSDFIKGGAIEIRINSAKDTMLMDMIQPDNKYLITIESETSMHDYITIRQNILALNNNNIITEIE